MNGALLFVCAANVCRSPMMELSFTRASLRHGAGAGWFVQSRGVSVRSEMGVCGEVRGLLGSESAISELLDAHEAAALDVDNLEGVDLVVVASRAERAPIARMRPDLRPRIFTLREAVDLGLEPVGADEVSRAVRAGGAGASPLATYATVLNARRGMPSPQYATRRRGWFTRRAHPADIPDVHSLGGRRHRAVLSEVGESVRLLHSQLSRFADGHAADVHG